MLPGALPAEDVGEEVDFRAGVFLGEVRFRLKHLLVNGKFDINFTELRFKIRVSLRELRHVDAEMLS